MVLGLVAMATTADSLNASMEALVCIVGNNQPALKEMERTGGFQVGKSYTVLLLHPIVLVTSFPGHSHLQSLVSCSVQVWKGKAWEI